MAHYVQETTEYIAPHKLQVGVSRLEIISESAASDFPV